jgi:hypothetical protein
MRLWSPSFRIDLFEQRCMSPELSRQGRDGICEMGYSRIKSMFLRAGRRGRGIAD